MLPDRPARRGELIVRLRASGTPVAERSLERTERGLDEGFAVVARASLVHQREAGLVKDPEVGPQCVAMPRPVSVAEELGQGLYVSGSGTPSNLLGFDRLDPAAERPGPRLRVARDVVEVDPYRG